jgi:hypothetical protein
MSQAKEPPREGLVLTHFGHAAQTAGGYNVVVRTGNLRLRRLLVRLVNRHKVAHAADCGMAGEESAQKSSN